MPIFLFRWICTVLMPGERWKEVRAEDFLTCKRHFTSSHITSSTSSKHWWSVFIIQCLMVMVLLCAFVTTMIQLVKQWKILHIKGMWLWGTTSFWKSGTSWSTGTCQWRVIQWNKYTFVLPQAWDKCAQSWAGDHCSMGNQIILCTPHEWTIVHPSFFQDWPESYATAPVGLCCYAGIDRYERDSNYKWQFFWTRSLKGLELQLFFFNLRISLLCYNDLVVFWLWTLPSPTCILNLRAGKLPVGEEMAQEEWLFELNSISLHPAKEFPCILQKYFFAACRSISLHPAEVFLCIAQNYLYLGLIHYISLQWHSITWHYLRLGTMCQIVQRRFVTTVLNQKWWFLWHEW